MLASGVYQQGPQGTIRSCEDSEDEFEECAKDERILMLRLISSGSSDNEQEWKWI